MSEPSPAQRAAEVLDLDAIRARADAATEGPWRALTTGPAGGDHWYVCDAGKSVALIHANDGSDEETRQPDADFIAAARTDVPALVARVRELEEREADLILKWKHAQDGYARVYESEQALAATVREMRASADAVHDDLVSILDALGLGDHARPYSAHEVVQREVLPAIRRALEGEANQ